MYKNGFTIIELLVGLVIAMLCMVMMLMLFKQITRTGLTASQDAEYDAQLETGVLITQKLVQNAGYGSGQAEDISIGSHNSQNAIFWRLRPNLELTPITYKCQGISETITAEESHYIHRLVLLKTTPDSCGTGALTGKNWSIDQPIVAIRSDSNSPIFSYNLDGSCTPFGLSNIKNGKKLTIIGARLGLTGIGKNIQRAVCLNNIP